MPATNTLRPRPTRAPPPEWAGDAGAWPAFNHDLAPTRAAAAGFTRKPKFQLMAHSLS
jgi:hypothetical protein